MNGIISPKGCRTKRFHVFFTPMTLWDVSDSSQQNLGSSTMTPSQDVTPKRPRRPRAARDLPDFHLRWHEFRKFAATTERRSELPKDERMVLRWLIELADRVGARDLS